MREPPHATSDDDTATVTAASTAIPIELTIQLPSGSSAQTRA